MNFQTSEDKDDIKNSTPNDEFSLEGWFHENKDWLSEHQTEIVIGTVVVLVIIGFVVWKIWNVDTDDLPETFSFGSTNDYNVRTFPPISSPADLPLYLRPYELSDFIDVTEDEINWEADEKIFTFHIFSYSIVNVDSEFLSALLLDPSLQNDFLKPWDKRVIKKMFDQGFLDLDRVQYFFQSDLSENYFRVVFLKGYGQFVVSRNFAEILGLRTSTEESTGQLLESEDESSVLSETIEDVEFETIKRLSEDEIVLSEEKTNDLLNGEDIDVFKLYDAIVKDDDVSLENIPPKFRLRIPEDNPFLDYQETSQRKNSFVFRENSASSVPEEEVHTTDDSDSE
jgi:hypothetical protein